MFYNPTNENATKLFYFFCLLVGWLLCFFKDWRLPRYTTSKNPPKSIYYHYYCIFSETYIGGLHMNCVLPALFTKWRAFLFLFCTWI